MCYLSSVNLMICSFLFDFNWITEEINLLTLKNSSDSKNYKFYSLERTSDEPVVFAAHSTNALVPRSGNCIRRRPCSTAHPPVRSLEHAQNGSGQAIKPEPCDPNFGRIPSVCSVEWNEWHTVYRDRNLNHRPPTVPNSVRSSRRS